MESKLKIWRERVAQGSIDLAELMADIEELAAHAQQADDEARVRSERANALRSEREALLGLRSFLVAGSPASTPQPKAVPPVGRRGSKRAAVASVLRDAGKPLRTAEIRDALVGVGAIQDGENAYHALQVTLSQMFRDRQLDRPSMGTYALLREEGANQE